MASAIKLNFINQSDDTNNSGVVIFQKNEMANYSEIAVAWKVIQNCGRGSTHSFTYPPAFTVSAADSYGNQMPQIHAVPGQAFEVTLTPSGITLCADHTAIDENEIEIVNNLQKGAIDALIYKDGRKLAVRTNVVPMQMAVFSFKPVIYIGVVSQVEEGDLMNAAIISTINTSFNLDGISGADIVMTGGGPGPKSTPFQFTLVNVVKS